MPLHSDAEIEAYVRATATLLELEIRPEYMPSVLANMRTLLTHGAVVTDFQAPFEIAQAPVFSA